MVPGEFVLRIETPVAPDRAWARVWDLGRHSEVIPLTTVALTGGATTLGPGAEFCARTELGPVGVDDTMRVLAWEPPTTAGGCAVVAKTGSTIGGRVEVTFSAAHDGGTRITWRQQVELPWLPSPLSGLEGAAARAVALGYRMVLRRLLVMAQP